MGATFERICNRLKKSEPFSLEVQKRINSRKEYAVQSRESRRLRIRLPARRLISIGGRKRAPGVAATWRCSQLLVNGMVLYL
jgi:hypothetical protein